MSSAEDVYLVYSLRLGSRGVFAGDFSILKAQDSNNKLVIDAWDSSRTLSKNGTAWADAKVTIEARHEVIKSYKMFIGRATYQEPEWVNAFVAVELKPEFSPILINDAATEYDTVFQSASNGKLIAQKNSKGDALKFEFPTPTGKKSATTQVKQPPGRFNAEKDIGHDHDLYGFVLPHRIWENGQAYRVLVGCSRKASWLPGPDDIDPYVAISVSPGPGPGGEG